jgi:hypothetical protein
MSLLTLIDDVFDHNRRAQEWDDLTRFGILAFTDEYSNEREDLSAKYTIVDLDASNIVFYRITGLQDGYLNINHGPETDSKVIQDTELDSLINIDQPVIYYHSGARSGNINSYFHNMIKGEDKLLVISNTEVIGNIANIGILTNVILSDQIPVFSPVILLADDQKTRTELWLDAQDRLRRIP